MSDFFHFVASMIYGLYFFGFGAILYVLGGAPIRLLTFWFDPDGRITHAFTALCCYHFIQVNPFWKVKFEGLENIDPKKRYILVSNHNSVFDILVLFGIRRNFKWVSKEEMFKVPTIGWTLYLNNYVKIRRRDSTSALEMLDRCKYWLARNVSVMIFPEGSRSPDSNLQPFRYGAFLLAHQTQVPIVPIVVDGTHPILPRHGRRIGFRSNICVRALPAVDPSQYPTDEALRQHVEGVMKTALADIRSQKQVAPSSVVARG